MYGRSFLAGFALACLAAFAAQAQQNAPAPAVVVQAAELRPLSSQAGFIGRAAAKDRVELKARVHGDQVKEGQVLFVIEREPYQATVDQKTAQRDAAKAALANADTQLKRAADLLRTNTGTQATYDQRLSEQLQARAAVEDAEAQLRNAQIQLSYTEIKSPISGRIGRATVSPGNIVGPDSGVLATVVSERPMRVLFPITQRELLAARQDGSTNADTLTVQIRLADGSLYKEKGTLDFIDVTADSRTDSQIVRAVFENKDGTLTDGQTLRVVLEEKKPAMVLAVQQGAVAIDQAGAYLFVVNDKNVVEQRRVKTGVTRDALVAIDDGLKAGEKVIVQGQQKVRPGMTVSPTAAPADFGKPK